MTEVQKSDPDIPGVRPVDLPEVRASLIRDHVPRPPLDFSAQGYEACGLQQGAVEEARQEAMRTADLYFVARAMGELAVAASDSLPAYSLAPEDLPGPKGLLLFGQVPEGMITREHGTGLSGVLWTTMPGSHGRTFVLIFPVIDNGLRLHLQGGAARAGRARWICRTGAFPLTLGDSPNPYKWGDDWTMLMIKSVKAIWLLMQQPLALTDVAEPDRAARKRLKREGYEPQLVRVIDLRRPLGSSGAGDGDSNYHHQWIVRGHWRQQWFPKRQVHRPVWIAPHVKGPEGAPMIGGEKVYAWKK